jgi:hypothetical protein
VPLAQTLQHTADHIGWAAPGWIVGAQPEDRLVFETRANGETERRALQGELSLLERE